MVLDVPLRFFLAVEHVSTFTGRSMRDDLATDVEGSAGIDFLARGLIDDPDLLWLNSAAL